MSGPVIEHINSGAFLPGHVVARILHDFGLLRIPREMEIVAPDFHDMHAERDVRTAKQQLV